VDYGDILNTLKEHVIAHQCLDRILVSVIFGCILDTGKEVKGRNFAIIIRRCHVIYRSEQLKTHILQDLVFSGDRLAYIVLFIIRKGVFL
jgi:hypothetical protein